MALSMQLRHKKQFVAFLLFSGVILSRVPLYADSSAEEQCEKLHTEALKKARQALTDAKSDEALRFLQEAAAISGRCATLPESDRRKREENVLASAPLANQVSARVLL